MCILQSQGDEVGTPGNLCHWKIHEDLLGKMLTFSFWADNIDDIHLFNSQLDFM